MTLCVGTVVTVQNSEVRTPAQPSPRAALLHAPVGLRDHLSSDCVCFLCLDLIVRAQYTVFSTFFGGNNLEIFPYHNIKRLAHFLLW